MEYEGDVISIDESGLGTIPKVLVKKLENAEIRRQEVTI